MRENEGSEAEDVMWGTPGTLVAAQAMLEATADERWRDAWQAGAEALWSRRDADGFWTQRLYGEERRGLTPPHGVVGQRAGAPAPARRRAARTAGAGDERAARADRRSARTASPTGRPAERAELPGPDGEIRLQWCAGAPGIVIAAADYLDEELLLAGAELVWRAGPHGPDKGAGICHGTAGNGYALLAAFGRTSDEIWLERARRFAVHALGQVAERSRRSLLALDGRRRHGALCGRLSRERETATPSSAESRSGGRRQGARRLRVERRAGVELPAVLADGHATTTHSSPSSAQAADLGGHAPEDDLAATGAAHRVRAGTVDRGPDDLGRPRARATSRREILRDRPDVDAEAVIRPDAAGEALGELLAAEADVARVASSAAATETGAGGSSSSAAASAWATTASTSTSSTRPPSRRPRAAGRAAAEAGA